MAGAPHVYIERENTLVAQIEMLATGDVSSFFERDGCHVREVACEGSFGVELSPVSSSP